MAEPGVESESQADTDTQPAWGDSVPEQQREALFVNNRFDGGKTPEGLAKLANSYLEVEKMASSRIKIPDENSTDEERKVFLDKFRPESPEKYELTRPPEGIPFDEGVEKVIRTAAHRVGISQAQLAAMNDVVNEYQVKTVEAQIKATEELNAKRWDKYRSEWGDEKTKENIELAKRAFEEAAPAELKELMSADQVEQDPILVATYSFFWRKTMDDTLVKGVGTRGTTTTKDDTTYRPRNYNSPEMYRNAKTEEDLKAKKWFETVKGYNYG